MDVVGHNLRVNALGWQLRVPIPAIATMETARWLFNGPSRASIRDASWIRIFTGRAYILSTPVLSLNRSSFFQPSFSHLAAAQALVYALIVIISSSLQFHLSARVHSFHNYSKRNGLWPDSTSFSLVRCLSHLSFQISLSHTPPYTSSSPQISPLTILQHGIPTTHGRLGVL